MISNTVRDFSKRGDAIPVPTLTRVQRDAYERFLQLAHDHHGREPRLGLEALLREIYPIESYDGSMRLEYLYYKLDEPRYTPDECRELRLTYGMPFRIAVRLVREGVSEIAAGLTPRHLLFCFGRPAPGEQRQQMRRVRLMVPSRDLLPGPAVLDG